MAILEKLDPAIAVLLIEHDMDIAFGFAERVTVLHQGRVLTEGHQDEVSANPARAGDLPGRSSGDGTTMLTVTDLHTYYGDSHVLQGVTLTAEKGTVTAVLGRNGVGKTTLCRSLVGLTPRACGAGGVQRRRHHRASAARIYGAAISLVPQGRRIFSSLTVHENLAIASRPGRPGRWMPCSVVSPTRGAARQPRQRAERRRAADAGDCARARGANPSLLIMDEPTEGLAPMLIAEVGRLIRRLKDEGMSILLAEQNAAFAVKLADYVHVMSKGKIVHSPIRQALERTRRSRRSSGVPAGASGRPRDAAV